MMMRWMLMEIMGFTSQFLSCLFLNLCQADTEKGGDIDHDGVQLQEEDGEHDGVQLQDGTWSSPARKIIHREAPQWRCQNRTRRCHGNQTCFV